MSKEEEKEPVIKLSLSQRGKAIVVEGEDETGKQKILLRIDENGLVRAYTAYLLGLKTNKHGQIWMEEIDGKKEGEQK